ncbi:hypothetical protein [Parachitinimonas caeni]|uniref:Uncharacterized protein n=1 Tax=Parachitinimonas caeni TaxID=3031301 RepID=A0ABT7DZH0_9NEIS|nr:hypothetical protein [Parachitinimonas caeni]MDK2125461.1 hypothetical protein [Parachitinimonas caeni]
MSIHIREIDICLNEETPGFPDGAGKAGAAGSPGVTPSGGLDPNLRRELISLIEDILQSRRW